MSKEIEGDPCKEFGIDCEKAESLVDRFIDDILDDDEKSFIRSHLKNCPGCNHGFEFESMFHVRMKSMAPISMPLEVKENIMLALGFPGMSEPMKGSFSALGSPDAMVEGELSSQFGIPKGKIPKGQIPRNDFFSDTGDSSSTEGPSGD